ncbi:MAG TPA: thioesterase family protein [Acidimicrobiia bacterium]|nr:thioesterase family protein [Acidimicrobiia bacterium]
MTAPTLTIERRVQWMDTDAAGIWHHSTLVRWAEEAEAELHRQVGIIAETFGATPRVHVEFDYFLPLRFDELVRLTLSVGELGRTSISYELDLVRGSERVASGKMIAVFIDRATGAKRSWPESIRSALSEGLSQLDSDR